MKKFTLIAIYFFLFFNLKCQIPISNIDTNTFSYKISNEFINSKRIFNDSDLSNKVVKQLYRENIIWQPRLFPHGDINIANAAINKYYFDFDFEKSANCNLYSENIWEAKGPNELPEFTQQSNGTQGTGQLNRLLFSPTYDRINNKTIFAASHYGGLFKSIDAGENWNNLNTDKQLPMCGVADVAVNFSNENIMFLAAGVGDGNNNNFILTTYGGFTNPYTTSGVYKSVDAGNNWINISNNLLNYFSDNGTIRRIICHPNNSNIVFIATSKGVFKTENALASSPTWTQLLNGIVGTDLDFRGLEFDKINNILYCSGKHIYKSFDNGNTLICMTNNNNLNLSNFTPIVNGNAFNVLQINIALSPLEPNKIFAYIVAKDPDIEIVYNSASIYVFDQTWSQIDFFQPILPWDAIGGGWIGIAVSPNNPYMVYYGLTKVRGTEDYRTIPFDFKSTYADVGFHADVHDLKFEPISSGSKLYAAHHGGLSIKDISFTDVNGWTKKNNGLHTGLIWSFDNSLIKKDQYIIGSQDCGVSIKDNSSINWKNIVSGDGYGAQIMDEKTFHVLYKYDKFFESVSIGTNNSLANTISETYSFPFGTYYNNEFREFVPNSFKIEIHPDSKLPILGGNELNTRLKLVKNISDTEIDLWRTESNLGHIPGINWIYSHRIKDFEISKSNSNFVYIVLNGEYAFDQNNLTGILLKSMLIKSQNGLTNGNNLNQNFFNITDNLPQSIYTLSGSNERITPVISGITVDPTNENNIWVAFSGYEAMHKVWKSTNGGLTWSNYDVNGDLPNLPVNDILFQDGSLNRLFIATDVGVYVNENNAGWCKYGDFLPNVRVNEIKINPCDQTLTAATYGRGLWNVKLPPVNNISNFKTIVSNEIWNDVVYSTGNIVIESPNSLKINQGLFMPKNSKIIVKPGAKLIVNGSTLTNACGEMWGGIEVWGNSSLSQTPQNQGYVVLTNATIENAHNALSFMKDGDWNTTGGYVVATSTTFKNNKRGAEFIYYHNFNANQIEIKHKSRFTNCTFIWDDDYSHPTSPTGITMYHVNGVQIVGCDFLDNRTTIQTAIRAKGLFTLDAGYSVLGRQIVIEPLGALQHTEFNETNRDVSRFVNLQNGVEAMNANTPFPITIDHSYFFNNYVGSSVKVVDNAITTRNKFVYEYATVPSGITGMIQMYFESATNYRVEGNIFEGSALEAISMGTYIKNSGIEPNLIYKNRYNRLYNGNYAQGFNTNDNSNVINAKGLQWLCNQNTNGFRDFSSLIDIPYNTPNQGVRFLQGNPTLSAGNTFSPNITNGQPNADYHIKSTNQEALSYYKSGSGVLTPTVLEGSININNATIFNACLSSFTSIVIGKGNILKTTQLQEKQELLEAIKNEINVKKAENDSLKEIGDRQELHDLVANLTQANRNNVRSTLLAESPYLSDNLLRELGKKETNLFPHAWYKELILLNVEHARKSEFMEFLKTKNNPLPNGQYNEINNKRFTTLTEKGLKELKIAELKTKKEELFNDLIDNELTDTLNVNWTKYNQLIQHRNHELKEIEKVETLLALSNFNEASTLLDEIELDLENYKYELHRKELVDYILFKRYVINLISENDGIIKGLDENEIHHLEYVANNFKGKAAVQARNMLCFHANLCAEIEIPKDGSTKRLSNNNAIDNEITNDFSTQINIIPNPNEGNFELVLEDGCEIQSLEVFDVLGKKTAFETNPSTGTSTFIELKNASNGLYLIRVKCADLSEFTKHILIKK